MLGRTANGLFWMFRYLERAENTARLLDAAADDAVLSRADIHDLRQQVRPHGHGVLRGGRRRGGPQI